MNHTIIIVLCFIFIIFFIKIIKNTRNKELLKKIDMNAQQIIHIHFYSDYDEITPQEFHEKLQQIYPFLVNPIIQKIPDSDSLEKETGSPVWEVFYTLEMIPNLEELRNLKNYNDILEESIGGEFDGASIQTVDSTGQIQYIKLPL